MNNIYKLILAVTAPFRAGGERNANFKILFADLSLKVNSLLHVK